MRIAQIAPLFESVPPRLYGGTERVVSYLTEELIRQGHQVTLFASGDSISSAKLVPCTSRALRLDLDVRDPIPHHTLMLDKVRERAADFDILHFHIDYLHFPLFRSRAAQTVTTLHGRQDLADHMPFYRRFSNMPLISISNAQRTPLTGANFVGTVHHGLPLDLHKPSGTPAGGYGAERADYPPFVRSCRGQNGERRSPVRPTTRWRAYWLCLGPGPIRRRRAGLADCRSSRAMEPSAREQSKGLHNEPPGEWQVLIRNLSAFSS